MIRWWMQTILNAPRTELYGSILGVAILYVPIDIAFNIGPNGALVALLCTLVIYGLVKMLRTYKSLETLDLEYLKTRLLALQTADALHEGKLAHVKRDIQIFETIVNVLDKEKNNGPKVSRIRTAFVKKRQKDTIAEST